MLKKKKSHNNKQHRECGSVMDDCNIKKYSKVLKN